MVLFQSNQLKSLIIELVQPNFTSRSLLSIVNRLLEIIHPKFVQSKVITIEDLQEWDFWPNIFIHYGMYVC